MFPVDQTLSNDPSPDFLLDIISRPLIANHFRIADSFRANPSMILLVVAVVDCNLTQQRSRGSGTW